MKTLSTTTNSVLLLRETLKSRQHSCTEFLIDCLKAREKYPHHADRIDRVIAIVEATMAQDADLIAHLDGLNFTDSTYSLTYRQ